MANKAMPLPYRSVVVLLGYATFVMAAREFLADIDRTFLGSSNIVYALALYAGGILLAIGAYQAARSE
jgi:hypothetical protein